MRDLIVRRAAGSSATTRTARSASWSAAAGSQEIVEERVAPVRHGSRPGSQRSTAVRSKRPTAP